LERVLTLESGYYHSLALVGDRTSTTTPAVITYTCPTCGTVYSAGAAEISVTGSTATLTCTGKKADKTPCGYTGPVTATVTPGVSVQVPAGHSVLSWGRSCHGQLGRMMDSTGTTDDLKYIGKTGIADYVTAIPGETTGKNTNILSIYAGAYSSGVLVALNGTDRQSALTNQNYIWGKSTAKNADQENGAAVTPGTNLYTAVRPLRGNSHNDQSIYDNPTYGAFWNRGYDLSLGEYNTVGVQQEGSVWSWGSNRNHRLGDYTAVNRTAPVQVGKEDFYQLLVNDANILAHQIPGTDDNFAAYDAKVSEQIGQSTLFTHSAVTVTTGSGASAVTTIVENPLGTGITTGTSAAPIQRTNLAQFQFMEIDLKKLFLRSDWGFNLRTDLFDDEAVSWKDVTVESMNRDLVTVTYYAFAGADGVVLADQSKVTLIGGKYYNGTTITDPQCWPTMARLTPDKELGSAGQVTVLLRDLEHRAQGLVLL
ncbi:MAG: RCC1 domain-containing protein, partial [Oscillospiraceae bacterium]